MGFKDDDFEDDDASFGDDPHWDNRKRGLLSPDEDSGKGIKWWLVVLFMVVLIIGVFLAKSVSSEHVGESDTIYVGDVIGGDGRTGAFVCDTQLHVESVARAHLDGGIEAAKFLIRALIAEKNAKGDSLCQFEPLQKVTIMEIMSSFDGLEFPTGVETVTVIKIQDFMGNNFFIPTTLPVKVREGNPIPMSLGGVDA